MKVNKGWLVGLLVLVSLGIACRSVSDYTKCTACALYPTTAQKEACKKVYCGDMTPPPIPSATATAIPTATPVSFPTSLPPDPIGPLPWETACSLVPSSGTCIHTNVGEVGKFRVRVNQAMVNVFNKYPALFSFKGTSACQWEVIGVANQNKYYWAVQNEIASLVPGVCTQFDGEQLNVKYSNDYSESFHPLRTDGDMPPSHCISDINGIYTFHCSPAGF